MSTQEGLQPSDGKEINPSLQTPEVATIDAGRDNLFKILDGRSESAANRQDTEVWRKQASLDKETIKIVPDEVVPLFVPSVNSFEQNKADLWKLADDERSQKVKLGETLHSTLDLLRNGVIKISQGENATTLSFNSVKIEDSAEWKQELKVYQDLIPAALNGGAQMHDVSGRTYITVSRNK